MKKISVAFMIMFWFCTFAYSQEIRTGEGKNSILLPTTNIGINVGESSLFFTTNNFPQRKLNSNGTVWGVSAKGKSKEGLASIFSESEIVPSSEISAIYGYSFSNAEEISAEYTIRHEADLKKRIEILTGLLRDSLELKVIEWINNIENEEVRKFIREKAESALSSPYLKYVKLEKTFKRLSESSVVAPEIAVEADLIFNLIENNETWTELKRIQQEIVTGIDGKVTEGYWKFTIYGHLGLQSSKFNVFKGWDQANIENSFKEETFRGSLGGFGLNYNFKNKWIFGFRYTYEETNNLELLTSKEYKVATSFTSGSSTASTQISKTAYPDTYNTAFLNRYNFDVLRFFSLGENVVLISDLYLRLNESTDEERLVSQSNLGLSTSFFKKQGKFIGGIYLEIPDLEQNIERRKPPEEQELKDWHERLTFGVFAIYSFSTFVDLF